MCVCVLASRWAILGPRAPVMVRSDYLLVKATLLPFFPPFGSTNSFAVLSGLLRQLFLDTPSDLLPTGGSYQGLEVFS